MEAVQSIHHPALVLKACGSDCHKICVVLIVLSPHRLLTKIRLLVSVKFW